MKSALHSAIMAVMIDGQIRNLEEIAVAVGSPAKEVRRALRFLLFSGHLDKRPVIITEDGVQPEVWRLNRSTYN